MRRTIAILMLVATVGCYSECAAKSGTGPTPLPSVSPTPTPSPSPSATPTPSPSCAISHLQWDKAPSSVAKDAFFEFSPMQWSATEQRHVKVSDSCNTGPRSFGIRWSVSPSTSASVRPEPNPFGAVVDRLSLGAFTVTVTLEGHTISREVTN